MNLGEFERGSVWLKERLPAAKLFSYLTEPSHILKYKNRLGGDALICLAAERKKKLEEEKAAKQREDFLRMLETARAEWKFSVQLLSDVTDADLIDYVVYLVKANEARYRYLLKMAKAENIACELWQSQKVHDT